MGKIKKTDAKRFIMQIQKYLANTLKIDSKTEYLLGTDRWSHKSDIFAEIKKPKMFLFVEVEGEQSHPDTNVTKYWYWMEKNKIDKKVTLVHVFGSIFYGNNYKSRSELCGFIARKIRNAHRNFVYIPIPKSKHYKDDGTWKLSGLIEQTKNVIKNITAEKQNEK